MSIVNNSSALLQNSIAINTLAPHLQETFAVSQWLQGNTGKAKVIDYNSIEIAMNLLIV